MIRITKKIVPYHLTNSQFYRALEDRDEEFDIPAECFKKDLIVQSAADVRQLLTTIRFWGYDPIPATLVQYVVWHRPREVISEFLAFKTELRYVEFLEALCKETHKSAGVADSFAYYFRNLLEPNENTLHAAAQVCRFQYENEEGKTWTSYTCALAVKLRRHDVLRFLHEHGCPWDESTPKEAAGRRDLASLQYAHQNGCPWDWWTGFHAILNDDMACLRYTVENNCPWNAAWIEYAVDHIPCYEYLRERYGSGDAAACAGAASKGNLSLLQQLRAEGCAWDTHTCLNAVKAGSLTILRYAHENGCPWEVETSRTAAQTSLPCLQYALEHGCPCDEHAAVRAVWNTAGLQALKYLHEHGCPWTVEVCNTAAKKDLLGVLQYAHQHGCPWIAGTVEMAAQEGHSQCLQFLLQNGCRWDVRGLNAAAKGNHHQCLIFMFQHGCTGDASTSASAAAASLPCLLLIHEHGCSWDIHTCAAAAEAGKLECLQYLHQHGCPWDTSAMAAAMRGGSLSCLVYLHEHGCWDAAMADRVPLTPISRKCIEYVRDHPESLHTAARAVKGNQNAPGVAAATRQRTLKTSAAATQLTTSGKRKSVGGSQSSLRPLNASRKRARVSARVLRSASAGANFVALK